MQYAMAVLTCAGVLFAFSVIAVLVGIPTAGIGFIIVQVVLWTKVMPKAWKWAMAKFDKSIPQDSAQ